MPADDLETLLSEAERALAHGDLDAVEPLVEQMRATDDPAVDLETAPIMRRLVAARDPRWLDLPDGTGLALRAQTLLDRPAPDDRVVIPSRLRIEELPFNGYRFAPRVGHSGWVVWAGAEEPGPTGSMNVPSSLLQRYWPDVVPYLALPPGWSFRIAPGEEDIWFDDQLLDGR